MQSFGVWLQENVKRDLVVAAIKYKIVHGERHKADAEQEEKMARRRAASMGLNYDQLEGEIRRTWKPGGCPHCGGLGWQASMSPCYECGNTGLQGMNDQQVKWWLAKDKEIDAMIRNHGMWRDSTAIHNIPKLKIAQDIMTAARRAGVPVPVDYMEWPDDPERLTSEYYQGHEQDLYLFRLQNLLHKIAEALYKKAGHGSVEKHVWGYQ